MNDVAGWNQKLVQYFSLGAKSRKWLGVEMEHFVVEKGSGKAVAYAGEKGIRTILSLLMKEYPSAVILKDDDFLGFQGKDFNVTLEPAAQLEISISPAHSVCHIQEIYHEFVSRLKNILSQFDYELRTVGCQPESRVEDLTLIPKRRYHFMDRYFQTSGTGGREMMRGTASMQISIDYESEEDFRRKLQAAYFYGPILKLLMDNSPSFQGHPLLHSLKRTEIWRRTDPVRCGILPEVFSPDYGFSDYADYIGRIPPIFLKHGTDMKETGSKTVADLFKDRELEDEQLIHVLSMAFPDVRLKQYVEIRFADAVPYPFMASYAALVKGLLYGEEGLIYAEERIRERNLTETDLLRTEDALMEHGWNADVFGVPAGDAAEQILSIAKKELSEEEQAFLSSFREVIHYRGIVNIPPEVIEQLSV